eukprot:CAMPEP_0174708120 /NCGR_PEP_ID=MMETSP1094-20130205/10457_1 /TAXON_ID=156173 /ORGANISM="Chrysochromulina brevifilum, Strain UTEX LB 985" /LENGTH=68 /DNA_ID=CAMNT_0015906625 /DNA_START=196 /DNA_END=399 /DNA_ORIENTATION=-
MWNRLIAMSKVEKPPKKPTAFTAMQQNATIIEALADSNRELSALSVYENGRETITLSRIAESAISTAK